MSVKMMANAWGTELKGNALLVLLAMCDFANDEGELYPSLRTLEKKARVSKTTLSYILNAFESMGVITRTRRKRLNNSDTSTLYKINHFFIKLDRFEEEYQVARNYKKSSQCEHPKNESENHNVNTQTANCEHLEPSISNHQSKEKTIKKKIKPASVIEKYKVCVSNLQSKVKQTKSFNAMVLKINELEKILTGLENYGRVAQTVEERYRVNLLLFIQDEIYLDYQLPVKLDTQEDIVKNRNRLIEEACGLGNNDEEIGAIA